MISSFQVDSEFKLPVRAVTEDLFVVAGLSDIANQVEPSM
jgi:hypothetical protein